MKQFIYAYADWHGLPCPTLIGTLAYERNGIDEVYAFRYDNRWLAEHDNLCLSADLQPWAGWQYPADKNAVPALFTDVMPDRWGRLLLKRREQLLAAKEFRSPRQLSSFEMLMLIHDRGRMGGLRFKTDPEGEFVNSDPRLSTPPFSKLRDLEFWSSEFEKSERKNLPPEQKWFANLVIPSTGLGGARPKANVLDENGILHIAKFASHDDTSDIERWEHFAHLLARLSGINAACTRLVAGADKHILLSRRFDRDTSGTRIHLASAMTLLGLKDGNNASTGHGYHNLVEGILKYSYKPETDLAELYRRVAFNICIGNSDDHFRNHAFVLTPQGWTLAPAYDINPTNNRHQALLVCGDSSEASLQLLLEGCESFLQTKERAIGIIKEVQTAVSQWRAVARRLQIPRFEQQEFERRFDQMSSTDLK